MRLTYNRLVKAEKIFSKIKSHYGLSRYYKKEPRLYIYHDDSDTYNLGFFFYNNHPILGVNAAACGWFRTLIGTMLHEYIHYLQNPRVYAKGPYWTKAEEVEANNIVKRDLHKFYCPN